MLLAALLGLVACGAGSADTDTAAPYVAHFPFRGDAPEAERYELTPMPGGTIQPRPEPSDAPPAPPTLDLEQRLGTRPMPSLPVIAAPGFTDELLPTVAWVNDGEHLAVITSGSGSCPSGPHDVQVLTEQEIRIALGPLLPDTGACSADLSAHVTVIELPRGITPTESLTAHFGHHDVTIPAALR